MLVEYGIKNNYDILVDCSGDIVLQDNMLEIVSKHFSPMYSGISHPNIFGEHVYTINSAGLCIPCLCYPTISLKRFYFFLHFSEYIHYSHLQIPCHSLLYSGISHPNIFGELDESFRFRDKCTGSCGRGIDLRFFEVTTSIKF